MVTDKLGKELKVGDVVLRSIQSSLAFHRIIKITDKSIVLNRVESRFSRFNSNVVYYDNPWDYKQLIDAENNNKTGGNLYINKGYASYGLIKLNKDGKL